ncbi:MAG TPA: Sua5/YciO/YrdC/YwlC family protein, partial [Terriglobales bacterium]|nr:Sua5/YciO/YrdC/YwlC family protein [Terriglobales bacterium]
MQRLRLDPHRTPSPTALAPLLRHLDAGGVIAIPTDTIYGLAANACDAAAVAEVYRLKGRDFGKALPLLVRDREQAAALALAPPPL